VDPNEPNLLALLILPRDGMNTPADWTVVLDFVRKIPNRFAEQMLGEPPLTSVAGVRRDKAALSSGCKPHPANAPAGSNRSSYGGNEVAEALGKRVTNW
jgi:hypothetical protein